VMDEPCDDSWDLVEDNTGCHPRSKDAFDLKCEEWACRDWMAWLRENLSFPFKATRVEDDDDAYFTDVADRAPFRLGHAMEVLDLRDEDLSRFGILVSVREGIVNGVVPLADLEVTPKKDKDYWPVREYTVWEANS
jgi:hypothetical protein